MRKDSWTATNGVGFYKLASGKKVGVGKAYLTYSGGGAREFFSFDEEATGVTTPLALGRGVGGEACYDLQGRRVSNPTKGLYIVNGKKTVIK